MFDWWDEYKGNRLKQIELGAQCIVFILIHGYIASLVFHTLNSINLNDTLPWHWYEYFLDNRIRELHFFNLTISWISPLGVLITLIVIAPLFIKKPIFGDAKYASLGEMTKAGLFSKKGVVLGRAHGKYVISDNVTHSFLCGPTRQGKGTGVIVPNCLAWDGSLIVLDVKEENYEITSGYRASLGHKVFFWSPLSLSGKSHRFNPLDLVSKNPNHRITGVQKIASLLVDVSDRDPMWGQEGRALFVAITLYVIEKHPTKTLGQVYRTLTETADLRSWALYQVSQYGRSKDNIESGTALSPQCIRGLQSFAGKSEKEASSVQSTLQSGLRIFENPIVDAATSASDFDIRRLRKDRMSIYIGIIPDHMEVAKPLLKLFVQLVIGELSQRLPQKNEPHKVLMLLDEMPSLGNMQGIVSAFTLLAGYNVRVMSVVQGLTWLDREYGVETRNAILSCCGHQVFMTASDEQTASYMSNALGERTIVNQSLSQRPFQFSRFTSTQNKSVIGRPLLSKQEALKLDPKKQIIITQGRNPSLVRKIQYYKDTTFKKRVLTPKVPPTLPLHSTAPSESSNSEKRDTAPGSLQNKTVEPVSLIHDNDMDLNLLSEAQENEQFLKVLRVLEREAEENSQFARENAETISAMREALSQSDDLELS